MSSRLVYSRNDLLRLRSRGLPLLRSMRRDLWHAKLLLKQPHDVPTRVSYRIPVIVGRSRSSLSVDEPNSEQVSWCVERERPRERVLVRIKSNPISRRQREPTVPSLLLTNLRSICNKFDEVSMILSVQSPDIAVFTESWLDGETPDSSISVPSYNIVIQI